MSVLTWCLSVIVLLCAGPARADVGMESDNFLLVQQAVQVSQWARLNTSSFVTKLNTLSFAEKFVQVAMKHKDASILTDKKKGRALMAFLGTIANWVGQNLGKTKADYTFNYASLFTCLKGPALEATDFALNLRNMIDGLNSCADNNEKLCLPTEILGIAGDVIGFFSGVYNIEQDCGILPLDEIEDCDTNERGYFLQKPKTKNLQTAILGGLSVATALASGILGAVSTCGGPEGGEVGPIPPTPLLIIQAVKVLSSAVDNVALSEQFFAWLQQRGGGMPQNVQSSPALRFQRCDAAGGFISTVLGTVVRALDLVAHKQYDQSDSTAGGGAACTSVAFNMANNLLDAGLIYCGYMTCELGFPKAEWRNSQFGYARLNDEDRMNEIVGREPRNGFSFNP